MEAKLRRVGDIFVQQYGFVPKKSTGGKLHFVDLEKGHEKNCCIE